MAIARDTWQEKIQVASRCIIGKVDGRGNGKAIICSRGCYPEEVGAGLLGRYSGESLIDVAAPVRATG